MVVVPALVKAYQLEHSVAIYPRVILDDPAMGLWREEFAPGSAHPHFESLVKRDRDGQHIIDIFNPAWSEFIPWTEFIPSTDLVPTEASDFREAAFKPIQHSLVTYRDDAKVYEKYAWLYAEYREREGNPAHARGDTVQMSFYEVRYKTNPDPPYPCGPWPDDEAAIVHFNTQYGPTVRETFTTLPTGTVRADFILIEQERRSHIGLHDIRMIPLYKKP